LGTHVVTCQAGYISPAGISFTVSCFGSGPGVSAWFDVLTCSVVACPALTVLNSDSVSIFGLTLDTHVVNCDPGFTSTAGNSFTANCRGTASGVSAWANELTCDAVACPALTVLNSDTSSVAGSTLAAHLVSCYDGYISFAGSTFTATCTGSGAGTSAWTGALTCNPVECPALTILNSDTSAVTGVVTTGTHLVICSDGYTSSSGTSFIATCSGSGPGVSGWSDVLLCEPVACSAVTVSNSDTTFLVGSTLATHVVTCDD